MPQGEEAQEVEWEGEEGSGETGLKGGCAGSKSRLSTNIFIYDFTDQHIAQ